MRKPDHTVTADTKLSARMHFGTSQIAWSPDGTWMVGVGDYGMMTMFHRSQATVGK
jgi:polycomb protein EED